MDGLKITSVQDIGDDRIYVEATYRDGDGVTHTLIALGWLSATTNYFDKKQHDKDGNRKPDAKPREMTDDEKLEYYESVVVEQNPMVFRQAPRGTLLYEAP